MALWLGCFLLYPWSLTTLYFNSSWKLRLWLGEQSWWAAASFLAILGQWALGAQWHTGPLRGNPNGVLAPQLGNPQGPGGAWLVEGRCYSPPDRAGLLRRDVEIWYVGCKERLWEQGWSSLAKRRVGGHPTAANCYLIDGIKEATSWWWQAASSAGQQPQVAVWVGH